MANIGIIGSGNIGAALTRLFTRAGHQVAVANSRGPASLQALASETGARAATVVDAVRGADVVVVTVPMAAVSTLPKDLLQNAAADLVVIDTSNYYPQQRDGLIAGVEAGMTESGWVEKQLGRPVIKVFNSIIAQHLLDRARPQTDSGRVALAVAGDSAPAKTLVMQLVDDIGFDPVDAGTMDESWRQQPGTPGYLKDYDIAGVRLALAEATPQRKPEWRATPNSPGTFESPA
ncbi:NAD(P)-binding domain-containing protein [Duganella sp. CY15W]|uniref:NADPH-dependent F420 reductase n=1 Tax=Duganella sp. CY15W TaxID=2692172 RepID=UPI00136A76C0|nr:NAD(P)-binding domain-containing protein [Duganella sp. CY15W]